MSSETVVVINRYREILPFLPDVVKGADSQKDALGFFPESVFHDYARKEQLIVLIEHTTNNATYVGHLLFHCTPPRAKIMQMFTRPECRGRGFARLMLDHLKSDLANNGFISMYARVAKDLTEANIFWEKQGFYIQKVVPGGKTKKRTILVRAHELLAPQLFARSGVSNVNPLGLDVSNVDSCPMYLIDLNVLYDIGPRRPKHEDAKDLFRLERAGICRLAISSEVSVELTRTAKPGRTDPMMDYSAIFPVVKLTASEKTEGLINHLMDIVVRNDGALRQPNANDYSDVRHLATVVQNQLAGLITNDRRVLNAATELKKEYGLYVFSSSAFIEANEGQDAETSYQVGSEGSWNIASISHESDEEQVVALLRQHSVGISDITCEWNVDSNAVRRIGAWTENELVGFMACNSLPGDATLVVKMVVDENISFARNIVQALVHNLFLSIPSNQAKRLNMVLPPGQAIVREVLQPYGFLTETSGGPVVKVAFNGIIAEHNWAAASDLVASTGLFKLPVTFPDEVSHDGHLPIQTANGPRILSIDTVEVLLYPALLFLRDRKAVITPIQRKFAEPLLGYSNQGDLLPKSHVAVELTRHFISDAKSFRLFERGAIIFFYESKKEKGFGAIVALAKVTNVYQRALGDVGEEDLKSSVLDSESVVKLGKSKMKTVTAFDNVVRMKNPVTLKYLQSIGCGRPNDLITTKAITSEQIKCIIEEGFRG